MRKPHSPVPYCINGRLYSLAKAAPTSGLCWAAICSSLLELTSTLVLIKRLLRCLEIPNAVPSSKRAEGCFDAARLLARLVSQVGADAKLANADRDQLVRNYLGRTVVLLREAIDTSPTLAGQIKVDADIKALESRPEFQAIMNTLVGR